LQELVVGPQQVQVLHVVGVESSASDYNYFKKLRIRLKSSV
jgi:hypothetical protein